MLMSANRFEELIEAMPKIAESVNHFQNESVQREAFTALIEAWRGKSDAPRGPRSSVTQEEPKTDQTETTKKKQARSPATRKRSKVPSIAKDLDLRPADKESFRSFVEAKNPRNHRERCAVAVYYLERILELDSVSVGHVFTAYRDVSWPLPSNMSNMMAQTASKKGWIDSRNMDSLTTTASGVNFVEHDLPRKPS
jgi:hypothetical protein